MSAFEHPFYNRDLLRVIMQRCMVWGPVTLVRVGSTHRLSRRVYADVIRADMCVGYRSVREGKHPNEVGLNCYDGWCLLARMRRATKGIPAWVRDKDFYNMLIPLSGRVVLELTPPSDEQLTWALAQDGMLLGDIPKNRRTPALEDIAIACDGKSLQFVSLERRKLWDVCERACRSKHNAGYALKWIDECVQTRAMAIECVSAYGCALKWVAPRLMSTHGVAICVRACQQDPCAWYAVPLRVRNDKSAGGIYDACARADLMTEWQLRWITNERLTAAIQAGHGGLAKLRSALDAIREKGIKSPKLDWESLQYSLADLPYEWRSIDACVVACQRSVMEKYSVPFEHTKIVEKILGWS
jgi:hypothetical protein